MKCLILAGGFATRLYPLTINRAKALLEYRGKPLISHIVEKIPHTIDIIVTTNKKFEGEFNQWLKTTDRDIELCIEEATTDGQKKGAIGAIDYWIRTENIKTDLMVVAGDNYFEFKLKDFAKAFDGKSTLIAVRDMGSLEKVCEGKPCQVGLAVCEGKRVVKFDEKPENPTSSLVATGVYILPQRVFPLLSSYCAESNRDNMGSFISNLVRVDHVEAYSFTELWIDISSELTRTTREPALAMV
jgi:glucose-1-phosphate thymidylyltransferase